MAEPVLAAYDPKDLMLPALTGAADVLFFNQLAGEAGAQPSPACALLKALFAMLTLIIPGGWATFVGKARRTILTSESTAQVSFEEGCVESFMRAAPAEVEPEAGGGGGGGAGVGGGGGGGGGAEGAAGGNNAMGAVDELVRQLSASPGIGGSWQVALYPSFDGIYTPQDLSEHFSFGRQPVKFCEMGEEGVAAAKRLAQGLHAVMLAASQCYDWLLPVTGPRPTYARELSNVVVNKYCLPLNSAARFVEHLYMYLPLGVALCPHGHKGVVPAASPSVKAADLDFEKEFCGLPPRQQPYSVPFFAAIFDALGFTALLNLNVLPHGRSDWNLDGLGGLKSAGARAVVFFWLHMLLAFGVDHALVVTAKVRPMILHVAMCVCDKVAVRKHRHSRKRPDGSFQYIDVVCMYLQLYGVSGTTRTPFCTSSLRKPAPPPPPPPSILTLCRTHLLTHAAARAHAHAGRPRGLPGLSGRGVPDGRQHGVVSPPQHHSPLAGGEVARGELGGCCWWLPKQQGWECVVFLHVLCVYPLAYAPKPCASPRAPCSSSSTSSTSSSR
jgi:hypothetical protein